MLFDSRVKVGAKILVSGGTRCNVTHRVVSEKDYQGGPSHFIRHALEAFTPDETIDFFKKIGVELVLEETGKYFPTTHSGKTVLEALLKEAARVGVDLVTGMKITEIRKMGEGFRLNGVEAKRVILATGGLSYPETGSDGTGLRIAESLGHTIVPTAPALTPLTGVGWHDLSGVSLNVTLSFHENGKKRSEFTGPFLFTHFGYSGPTALNISRFVAYAPKGQVFANFLPSYRPENLEKDILSSATQHPKKTVKNFLAEDLCLPERFCEVFLKKINGGVHTLGRLTHAERDRLVRNLLRYPLNVTGVVGYKKAEVTAGGVDLREVKVGTMESKSVSGLYFAGEILDIDGRIGGFNFQWAWSTGAVAGKSAAKSLQA